MTENNNPKKTAELFASEINKLGYNLDFSEKSLVEEVDKILDFEIGTEPNRFNKSKEILQKMEINLEAYVGETLCRLFDGKWTGEFSDTATEANFYLSHITFDEYRIYPSHYIQYRISNGKKSEGAFENYFKRVKLKILDREKNFNE